MMLHNDPLKLDPSSCSFLQLGALCVQPIVFVTAISSHILLFLFVSGADGKWRTALLRDKVTPQNEAVIMILESDGGSSNFIIQA